MTDPRDNPVMYLKGVGPKRAELLNKLNINTCADLIRFFPRRYLNLSEPQPIRTLTDGQDAVIVGKISTSVQKKRGKKATWYMFEVRDAAGDDVFVILYNRQFYEKQLVPGTPVLLHGPIEVVGCVRRMNAPAMSFNVSPRIEPIYHLTEGLTSYSLAKNIKTALDIYRDQLSELLLPEIRRAYDLPGIADAYRMIHFPQTVEEAERARNRFIFEELFLFTVGVRILKLQVKKLTAPKMEPVDMTPFLKQLPYELTGAQKRVIRECFDGLRKPHPMSRLIQGDVGSGKTVIAAAIAYLTAKNGKQTALMVPTEILAMQHYETLSRLLTPCGIKVELLTGSMRAAEKRDICLRLEAGATDLVIGTHALLQKSVKFRNLAVAIADEQHRFGVQQRAAMQEKGENPHMIFLSATPIPRSLGLVLYGDLDISILDELPPGRTPITTARIEGERKEDLYRYLHDQALKGEQAYIVCPAVEGSENMESAVDFYEKMKDTRFRDISIACLHGRIKGSEKERILSDFAAGKISILIATTVVEVGVDVPNATVMVIENAELFGLSQLHQLRGRVGRGKKRSYCFVLSDDHSLDTDARLNAFCATNDGFLISRKDLELRGPGDFLGNRQHGLPPFQIADLTRNMKTLEQVTHTVDALFEDPSWFVLPENRALFVAASEMLKTTILQ